MPSYKLYYFDGRGRGELIRMIFATAGIKYEDFRFSEEEWDSIKPNTPLGQVPVLELEDGTMIPQSGSIARYLARKFHLAGKNDEENLRADVVVDTLEDFRSDYKKKIPESTGKEQKEAADKFFKEDCDLHLHRLEKLISMYGSNGYSVGSSLTWADLKLHEVVDHLLPLNPNLLEKYDRIKAVKKSVENYKNIGSYIRLRKPSDF